MSPRRATHSLDQGIPGTDRAPTANPSEINSKSPNRTEENHAHLPLATSNPAHIVWALSPWETSQKARKMPKSAEFQQKGGVQALSGRLLLVVTGADSCVGLCPPFNCCTCFCLSPSRVNSDLQKTRELIWKAHSGQPQMPAGCLGRQAQCPTYHLPNPTSLLSISSLAVTVIFTEH